jgi:hypothetical protein
MIESRRFVLLFPQKRRLNLRYSLGHRNLFGIVLILLSIGVISVFGPGATSSGLKFRIVFTEKAHEGPITGRAYIIISRSDHVEPRFQTGYTGVPVWAKNVEGLQPEEGAVIDGGIFGYPLKSIDDIPPGEYFMQGFINVYTEFKRSDGHTLWLHNDQWEGQRWNRSPGNLYSDVRKIFIDPSKDQTISVRCTHVIPPVVIPADTQWVKRIKFQSTILSEFWGQPVYLGATFFIARALRIPARGSG